jgi:hypothetical protein
MRVPPEAQQRRTSQPGAAKTGQSAVFLHDYQFRRLELFTAGAATVKAFMAAKNEGQRMAPELPAEGTNTRVRRAVK